MAPSSRCGKYWLLHGDLKPKTMIRKTASACLLANFHQDIMHNLLSNVPLHQFGQYFIIIITYSSFSRWHKTIIICTHCTVWQVTSQNSYIICAMLYNREQNWQHVTIMKRQNKGHCFTFKILEKNMWKIVKVEDDM